MNTLKIAVVNKATVPLGQDLQAMVQAVQKQATRDFAPAWNVDVDLIMLDDATDDYDNLIFFNDADQAGALGYHDLSPKGHAYGKVFVNTTLRDHETVSSVFSHELLEMLADPNVDQIAKNPRNGWIYALEDCDAVETQSYLIDGIPVSNFVFPAWFDPNASASTKLDFLGNVHAPFFITPGGYMPVQINGQWTQTFGSQAAQERYMAKEKDHNRTHRIIEQTTPRPMGLLKYFEPSKFPIIPAPAK